MVDEIDIVELQGRLQAGEDLIVRCTASWNSRLDEQLVTVLERVHLGKQRAQIVSLDTDDERAWPSIRLWRVLNLPALVCFRKGEHVDTIIGISSVEYFQDRLESLYGKTG